MDENNWFNDFYFTTITITNPFIAYDYQIFYYPQIASWLKVASTKKYKDKLSQSYSDQLFP